MLILLNLFSDFMPHTVNNYFSGRGRGGVARGAFGVGANGRGAFGAGGANGRGARGRGPIASIVRAMGRQAPQVAAPGAAQELPQKLPQKQKQMPHRLYLCNLPYS
ncbi:chromatin target of PRMT1 protein isoform X1 [Drosophila persimilis]|nr:chromatin target of PRMT1 protein isoform X1 [Drosophila persimilis]